MGKRICIFAGNMNNGGGTEHMTQLLANELALDEKYEVYILSKSGKGESTFYPLNPRIKYHVLNTKKYRKGVSLIKDVWLLRKYIKANKIDILINVDVSLAIVSLPLEVICPSLKQVFWEHFCVRYDSGNTRMDFLRKNALRFGEAYVVLTPEDVIELQNFTKFQSKIVHIPNICSYSLSKKSYDLNSRTIISVGNMLKIKGFNYALGAAQNVFRRHPDWNWFFYGDGSELESLKRLTIDLKIENNVRFMGRVKDIQTAYEQASICVMTSVSEGFGLVLIEAQAHNLPTVAFDVPYGPRNIIKNNVNGFLCEPFDADEMADRICELIEDREKRKSFSDMAICNLNEFSAQRVARRWKELFEKI